MFYVTFFDQRPFSALVFMLVFLLGSLSEAASGQQTRSERDSRRPAARSAGVDGVKGQARTPKHPPLRHRLKQKSRLSATPAALQKQKSEEVFFIRAAAGLTGASNASNSVADVDGDGNLDILTTGTDTDGNPSTTLYLGNGQGSFATADAGLVDAGFGSTSITDVNGDGTPDMLITGEANASDTTNVATLYLGDGQGGFTEAEAGLTGVRSSATSIADVNGDENPDLLISGDTRTYGDSNPTTTLYLGDGEGDFTKAEAGLTGAQRSATSIADVDEDGNLDILITGLTGTIEGIPTDPATTLYLGDGQGEFTEANASLNDASNGSTSIADVNGDENQDLLITGGVSPNGAVLYFGNGQGEFSQAEAGLTGVPGGSSSIADVDSDGNQDLLTTGDPGAGTSSVATLYLGDGQGGFSKAGAGLNNVPLSSALTVDFYGDGDQDLLLGSQLYVNPANQVPPNQPPRLIRTFEYDRPLAPGLALRRGVQAGDPDGDSLALKAPSNPNVTVQSTGTGRAAVTFTPVRSQGGDDVSISVEAEDPSGSTQSFSTSVEVSPVVAVLPDSLADVDEGSTSIADVDGDGNQDLLITGNAGTLDNPDPIATLYLGNGQGGFTDADAGLNGVWLRSSTSIADVNGDGNQDLLITGGDANLNPTTTLYLGDGQGGFTEAGAGLTGVQLSSTTIADASGDGNRDLLITGSDGSSPTATLYLGDGQGSFSEAGAGLTGTRNGSASIADVDGDGNQDLLITGRDGNGNPTATLYLGDGQGGFTEAGAGLTGTQNGSASITDVDGDGNQDLLITGNSSASEIVPTATLYLGDGQGGFTEAGAGLTGVFFYGSTAIADFDGDQNKDLLINGYDSTFTPTATLYLGNGQGSFAEADAGFAGAGFSAISTADLDGDSDQDVLATGFLRTTFAKGSLLYENLFDSPLPVELAGLKATADGEKARLTWQTVSETGNAGFEVQRKAGQSGWEQVGFVESKASGGTTTETQSYRFTDRSLPYEAERLEYRLRQVDTDGSASYSDSVTVERTVDEMELLGTYPNPAQSRVTVRYAIPEPQDISVRLYDVLGRRVRTVIRGEQSGRHKRQVDLSGLASGVYFLRLSAEGQMRTQKLTVVR